MKQKGEEEKCKEYGKWRIWVIYKKRLILFKFWLVSKLVYF